MQPTMRVSPNPVKLGLGVTMTATVSDTFSAATIVRSGVTFTDTVAGQMVPLNGGAAVVFEQRNSGGDHGGRGVAGAHVITAHYGGMDNSFLGSTGQASLTVRS